MEIWKNHWKEKRHKASRKRENNNKNYCIACHNTRLCRRCSGAGCADCDYTGICESCILDHERPYYGEGIA